MAETLTESVFVIPCDSTERTFGYDDQLPSLPVPSLEHTLQLYVDSIKPFVTQEELDNSKKLVNDFQYGIGLQLHEKLVEKAKKERNWVERWWEDLAYLSNRQPLLPYCSMDGVHSIEHEDWTYNGVEDQLKHSSLYVYHLLKFWKLLRSERIKPNKSVDNKTLFSMSQFRRLYNTVRIARLNQDELKTYFKTESEGACSSELILLCNGHLYAMDTVDENGEIITPLEIQEQFRYIRQESVNTAGPSVAILTCDNRDSWAKNRTYLQSISTHNKNILQKIEESCFAVVLDMASPVTKNQISTQNLCGDYNNRWADKSQCPAYYSNGRSGGIFDHTAYDGICSVTAAFYGHLAIEDQNGRWEGTQIVRVLPKPVELKFDLDTCINNEIKRLQLSCEIQKNDVIVTRNEFSKFGKTALKPYKLHPDSLVQNVLQLAYYRLHGKPAPCYETATTRAFYNGRTETVRSCTVQCLKWVKSMDDPNLSDQEKRVLLEESVERHNFLMKEGRENAGCDRHLFGMYCIALEQNLSTPEIFQDPAFLKSGGAGNFILSTSCVGYTTIGGGVAPMCLDGYGVFYNILPNSIYLTITSMSRSHETSADKLFNYFSEALHDTKRMLEGSTNISKL